MMATRACFHRRQHLPGTYALDPANGATFGRGTAQFAGHTFAFYIVDATQIMFLQEDSQGGSSGDAVLQSGAIPTNNSGFTGSFAYLVGGSSLSTFGPDAAVARFTADGAGGIGTISYDENNNGAPPSTFRREPTFPTPPTRLIRRTRAVGAARSPSRTPRTAHSNTSST